MNKWRAAKRLLDQHPKIAAHDIHTACGAANVEAVAAFLDGDPSAVSALRWQRVAPLKIACASGMHEDGPAAAAAS
jgi:hypothetical protein